jgi:Na+/H+-dicarboxylate symporter
MNKIKIFFNNIIKFFAEITIVQLVFLLILFLFGLGIYSNIQKDSHKTPLEKFYQQHPDAYKKDMQQQKQIQDINNAIQTEKDRQKL